MRFITALVCIGLLISSTIVVAQSPSFLGEEPSRDLLGAPLYPGAEFIRTTEGLTPEYQTAMYISLVPFELVENFFNRQLAEKRQVMYDDRDIFLTAYLLKTWSDIPAELKRKDIEDLRKEPTVEILYYDPDDYESVAQIYDHRRDGKNTAAIIRNGNTMILYTYKTVEKATYSQKVIGRWRESSRDLPAYYGSILTLREDGTYTFAMTPENMRSLSKNLPMDSSFDGMDEKDIIGIMKERNPENGIYSVVDNTIFMESDEPVDGDGRKSGLVDAGTATMKLELVGKPRLTFIMTRKLD